MKYLNPNLGEVEDDERINIQREVIKYLQIECFKQGDIVYQHGTEGDKFYIVLEGELDGYLPDSEEKELVLVNQIKTSETFGQKSLIYKLPRLMTVIAQKDSVCGVLQAKEFLQILKKSFSLQESQQINFLWELPYFNKLEFKQVKRVHTACTLEKFQLNQQVFREDIDLVTNFYIVKTGDFAICKKFKLKNSNDQDSQQNESQQEFQQQMMKSQKYVNKKIYSLGQCEFFGLNDIIKQNTKRQYSVQCISQQGEVFCLSKDLFYLIIKENPDSASYIQKLNKRQNTNLENLICNMQSNQSIDSSASTPLNTPLQDDQNSPSNDFTPINISQFYQQQQRFSEKIQIKYDQNHQMILSKNTIDSLISSQNGEELNTSLTSQQNDIKINTFMRKNRKKQITIQPQNPYKNTNTLEILTNKEDRRKSYSPNEITKDLIDQLYNLNKQNLRSSLTQIPQNILGSQNTLDLGKDKNKIKSFVNLPLDEKKHQKTDISFSEFDHEKKHRKHSENLLISITNFDEKKSDKLQEHIHEPKHQSSLGFSLNEQNNTNTITLKLNSQILNHLNEKSSNKVNLAEITSEDSEKYNFTQSQPNQIITINIPDNINNHVEPQNEQSHLNISQNKQLKEKQLPQILIKQNLTEQRPSCMFEKGDPTLRHLDEEDNSLQNIKHNMNKQNTFVSCYSYLPSISNYFMKKQENPIDQMAQKHSSTTQLSTNNPRIQQIDIQQHQLNRKLKQGLNKSQEDISLVNQSRDDQQITGQIFTNQTQEAVQSSSNKYQNASQETQYLPSVNQQTLNTESKFQSSYYHNSRPRMSNSSMHNQTSYQSYSQNINQSFSTKANNQNNQIKFQSQNNLQAHNSFEKKSPLPQTRSASQEQLINVNQQAIQQKQLEYSKKMSKASFLLGERPKKEVIGVFNADFFTSLKGKFIKQFTYNPQIFKDIQRYKFEDFLKKHLHDGPLSDYLKNNGTIESNSQKKKDQEDFRRQKKIVEDIATSAIESLKYFHRQQMRKSQGLLSSVHQEQKLNAFQGNNSKLNSLNMQNTQSNIHKSQSPLRKSGENINFQSPYQKQNKNLQMNLTPIKNLHRNTRSQYDIITVSQNYGFQNIEQRTQSPIILNKNINSKMKKTQLNFMLGNHGVQNPNQPMRLHSFTQQHKGNKQSFQFLNQSQL